MTLFHTDKCCYLVSAHSIYRPLALAILSTVPDP